MEADNVSKQELEDGSMPLLFNQLMRLHFLLNYSLLEKLDIHPGQVPLLFQLYHHGGLSQKELVNELLVKPPTLAVMIKRMEKGGFVRRVRDGKDQRITRIFLSDKGIEAAEQIRQIMQRVERACFSGFTSEEIQDGEKLLNRVKNNLIAACHTQNILCCDQIQRGESHAETIEIP